MLDGTPLEGCDFRVKYPRFEDMPDRPWKSTIDEYYENRKKPKKPMSEKHLKLKQAKMKLLGERFERTFGEKWPGHFANIPKIPIQKLEQIWKNKMKLMGGVGRYLFQYSNIKYKGDPRILGLNRLFPFKPIKFIDPEQFFEG